MQRLLPHLAADVNQMPKRHRALVIFMFLLAFFSASCAQGEGTGATLDGPGAPTSMTATATSRATSDGATTTAPAATTTLTRTPTVEPPATSTPELGETPDIGAGGGLIFDGDDAFEQLQAQMDFGPRWPGSPGHEAVGDYIVAELEALDWDVEEQLFAYMDVQGRNIIARANVGEGDVTIVGAHYDTRRVADQTPGAVEEQLPVPGAVDGASGVAVLLELARTLDLDTVRGEVWLAFFDLEDNGGGGFPNWDWIVGSTYMAENLSVTPAAMVLVDMIGDADQQLYYEGNSDPELRQRLWAVAAELGYDEVFIPEVKYTMIDDHVPFVRRGIRAVDIIDFDYPYWHTVEDTADKASAASLERVGRTVEMWLETGME